MPHFGLKMPLGCSISSAIEVARLFSADFVAVALHDSTFYGSPTCEDNDEYIGGRLYTSGGEAESVQELPFTIVREGETGGLLDVLRGSQQWASSVCGVVTVGEKMGYDSNMQCDTSDDVSSVWTEENRAAIVHQMSIAGHFGLGAVLLPPLPLATAPMSSTLTPQTIADIIMAHCVQYGPTTKVWVRCFCDEGDDNHQSLSCSKQEIVRNSWWVFHNMLRLLNIDPYISSRESREERILSCPSGTEAGGNESFRCRWQNWEDVRMKRAAHTMVYPFIVDRGSQPFVTKPISIFQSESNNNESRDLDGSDLPCSSLVWGGDNVQGIEIDLISNNPSQLIGQHSLLEDMICKQVTIWIRIPSLITKKGLGLENDENQNLKESVGDVSPLQLDYDANSHIFTRISETLSWLTELDEKQNEIRFESPSLREKDAMHNSFNDFLQEPLQPLAHHLPNPTYGIFEQDVAKYDAYEDAVSQYFLERVPGMVGGDIDTHFGVTLTVDKLSSPSSRTTLDVGSREHLVVLGAGRGPLISCILRAVHKVSGWDFSNRASPFLLISAVEKNPHVCQFLKVRLKEDKLWNSAIRSGAIEIQIVEGDGWDVGERLRMQKEKCRVSCVISELLGSFGDNELSPECIEGFMTAYCMEYDINSYEGSSVMGDVSECKLGRTKEAEVNRGVNNLHCDSSPSLIGDTVQLDCTNTLGIGTSAVPIPNSCNIPKKVHRRPYCIPHSYTSYITPAYSSVLTENIRDLSLRGGLISANHPEDPMSPFHTPFVVRPSRWVPLASNGSCISLGRGLSKSDIKDKQSMVVEGERANIREDDSPVHRTVNPVFTFVHNFSDDINTSTEKTVSEWGGCVTQCFGNSIGYSSKAIVNFVAQQEGVLSGFIGYFESVLYESSSGTNGLSTHQCRSVVLSTVPMTHTPGMYSWFPIYFPLLGSIDNEYNRCTGRGLHVLKGDNIQLLMDRCCAFNKGENEECVSKCGRRRGKVWYEWCGTVTTPVSANKAPECISHNADKINRTANCGECRSSLHMNRGGYHSVINI
eukprot:Tbor_TRINITY_DN7463_c0_g1::TRINITY_DN7463_c0_g1_i1::g.14555::m.14555/K02516/PRMT5, HSL7; type II protein arginine methyltransferase